MIRKGTNTIIDEGEVGLWVFHGHGKRERRWGMALPMGRVKVGLGKGL